MSKPPSSPYNDDLPSAFSSMASSNADRDTNLGPSPVFGLMVSDSFPFANEKKARYNEKQKLNALLDKKLNGNKFILIVALHLIG